MLEINNTTDIQNVDDQHLKQLGLKRTMAYVRDDMIKKTTKGNNAERQARFRNKEKALKEIFKDLGVPPEDIVDFVKSHGWIKVSESIKLSTSLRKLPKFMRWIFQQH